MMEVKGVLYEDYVNYKKPSMVIMFPKCTFKCEKESGCGICHNSALAKAPSIMTPISELIYHYMKNPFTQAIVFSGLEPFDSTSDVLYFIKLFREKNNDDIVIFTGYTEEELSHTILELQNYKNIYIKFGRFIPNQESHFDEVLGIDLASNNQYGKKIS